MAITLSHLSARLKELSVDKLQGSELVLRGLLLLLDHAGAPWHVMIDSLCPPRDVVRALLKALQQKLPTRDVNLCAALALQQAYLQALQQTLHAETARLDARFDLDAPATSESLLQELAQQLEQAGMWKLEPLQMKFADLPAEPLLKDVLEPITATWLKIRLFRNEHQTHEVSNFARRIACQMYPQLMRVVADNSEFYLPLMEYLQQAGYWESPEIAAYRASLLQLAAQPLFLETFAMRDIYTDLHATRIVQVAPRLRYGAVDEPPEDPYEKGTNLPLMQTMLSQLEDREHVVFLQADSGAGKSFFCRILAARVAAEYPEWLPILVNLGDERFNVQAPLEEVVRTYLQPAFDLTDELLQTRRVLFILDGADELVLPTDTGEALKQFFDHLAAFQSRCAADLRWRHKVLVTGRPFRFQEMEPALPANFFRLNIEKMDHLLVIAWLSNWEKLFGPQTTNSFTTLLEQAGVFAENSMASHPLQRLVSDPLCLYLLAVMHRHGVLTQAELDHTNSPTALYHRLISWICGAIGAYPDAQHNQRILTQYGISPVEIRLVLQEIAFCIWHAETNRVPVSRLTTYLSSAAPKEAKKLVKSGIDGIHNLLLSFSFQPQAGEMPMVEFAHKTFGEYLAAEKMAKTLGQIAKPRPAAQDVPPQSPAVEAAHRFYSVFGVKLLTDEMWEYVMNILTEHYTQDELLRLTEHLYALYLDYSNGRWMNEDIARTQWGVLKRYDIPLHLLEFEVQAGVNLFVLLCLLYWKVGGVFEICGRPQEGTFDPNRFRKMLAFGEIVGTFGLFRRIHHLLKNVSMPGANLVCMNFRRANLQGANLQGVVLRDGNLRHTNLREANLYGADLRVANLQNADLRDADMRGVNLEDSDIRDANLRGANLEGANFLCTEVRDADFRQANLQKAVLYGANLQGAIFQDANMTGAIISQHQLERERNLFSAAQIAALKIVHD